MNAVMWAYDECGQRSYYVVGRFMGFDFIQLKFYAHFHVKMAPSICAGNGVLSAHELLS